MYTLILLHDGGAAEALVLANTRSWMRLAVAGRKDAVELQLFGLNWFDEHNKPVEFGFMMAEVESTTVAPRLTRAAGGYAR
jgi:hypothetical protein